MQHFLNCKILIPHINIGIQIQQHNFSYTNLCAFHRRTRVQTHVPPQINFQQLLSATLSDLRKNSSEKCNKQREFENKYKHRMDFRKRSSSLHAVMFTLRPPEGSVWQQQLHQHAYHVDHHSNARPKAFVCVCICLCVNNVMIVSRIVVFINALAAIPCGICLADCCCHKQANDTIATRKIVKQNLDLQSDFFTLFMLPKITPTQHQLLTQLLLFVLHFLNFALLSMYSLLLLLCLCAQYFCFSSFWVFQSAIIVVVVVVSIVVFAALDVPKLVAAADFCKRLFSKHIYFI